MIRNPSQGYPSQSTQLQLIQSEVKAKIHLGLSSVTEHRGMRLLSLLSIALFASGLEMPTRDPRVDESTRVVVAVRQRGLDQLEGLLERTSDPSSADFGRHLSREEVLALTSNPESFRRVSEVLVGAGVSLLGHTGSGEYILAEGPSEIWRDLLSPEVFDQLATSGSADLTGHDLLGDHVAAVFNAHNRLHSKTTAWAADDQADASRGRVTPSLLKKQYNIVPDESSRLANQSIYELAPESFSPSDLKAFQKKFNLPSTPIAKVINQSPNDNRCLINPDDCGEGNLDTQYILSASRARTSVFVDTSDDFVLGWILKVVDDPHPAHVLSISFGTDEADITAEYSSSFNTEALKLSAMGVTIVASSGDDGVHDRKVRGSKSYCGYSPHFPASSRYVTAVGGTQGPELGNKEIACQSQLGGGITTGGGFSKYSEAASYQTAAIKEYFANLPTSKTPVSGYNKKGRGYPDVSLVAVNYVVILNGEETLVGGTSAAAPVFAGMVSLVNGARLKKGKSSLGFLNPALYKLSSKFINDITSGSNKCAPGPTSKSASVCCSQGFEATRGWDPVTGLGSVDFEKFMETLVQL